MRTAAGPVLATFAIVVAIGCGSAVHESGPRVVQGRAPGESSRPLDAGAAAGEPGPQHTEADVRFMRDMIVHHAQALEMSRLAPERAARDDVRLLARRIELSQRDEIALMRRWLAARGEQAPDLDGHGPHHGTGQHHARMPGMLTADELADLAAARGSIFDRLFLESMIYHHEGALVMVEQLLASDGAGQDAEIFQLASDIDVDQRIEIERMRRMLRADG